MGFSSLPGPVAYERFYVPHIFAPCAELVLERLALREGERVLDVATGPGTVARLAAPSVGPKGHVVGVDLSPEMIAIARTKAPVAGASIEYRIGPAAPIPLDDESFDVVVCQQSLQFFPDVPAAMREMRRVLVPGGRLGVAVWSTLERCDHFAAIDKAIDDASMHETWHHGMRLPFGRFDAERLTELLHEAGFSMAHVEAPTLEVRFASVEDEIESLAVTPLATLLDEQTDEDRNRFLAAVRRRLEPFVRPDGVVTSMCALVATARR